MTLARGRVLRAAAGLETVPLGSFAGEPRAGRRLARVVVEAKDEASRVIGAAERRARTILDAAERNAEGERLLAEERARTDVLAEFAGRLVRLRRLEAEGDARTLDRAVELGRVLAERLIGRALELDATWVARLARQALSEAGGARRVVLHARPEDAELLRSVLAEVDPEGRVHEVLADLALGPGDLVLHTELGVIEARVGKTLDRLAERLREALLR